MNLKIKAVAKHNPREPEAAPKYYASAIHNERVGVKELANSVSQRCSLRKSDVQGVLIALMDLIPEEICKGNIVSLGELGTFYANTRSEGVDAPEDLSSAAVKGFKLVHLPTKELKKQLRLIDVSVASEA